MNIHFTDPQPGEMKMIAAAGFRWVRMDLKWDATERERGRYDFSAYDRLMQALDEFNIRAIFILDYGNPLYAADKTVRTEAARQAFARWAVAAAKHFAGRGVLWEIFNEPNIKVFWPPQPIVQEYIALALAVGRGFRVEVPNEKLIGPAVSGIDFAFLEACFKAGLLEYWSAVSVHPYRQTNPETVANDYCRLREMIDRYHRRYGTGSGSGRIDLTSAQIPIISSEWGFSAAWPRMDEAQQGALVAREMLTNLANGIPISIWYDWRDDGTDPKEPEHHFGLVRNSHSAGTDPVFAPKQAYLAAKTLNEILDGWRFEKRLNVGSDEDYILVFVKGNELRIAAWTTSATPHRVVIPSEFSGFRVVRNVSVAAGPLERMEKQSFVNLTNAPIYLTRS